MASAKCRHCGAENPPEAVFCANCGSSLVKPEATKPVVTLAPAPVSTPPEAAPLPAAPKPAITKYSGFWIRLAAVIIDWIILVLFSFIISVASSFFFSRLFHYFSPDIIFAILLSLVTPWLYHWLFIGLKGQTPGKMAVGIKVVNRSGLPPGLGIAALREIPGKIISSLIIYLGFFWIGWDGKKQGWHDMIANTYVVPVKPKR